MGRDTENTNGSHELEAIAVDTKGACKITGFSRQRLSELRNDPTSGFPEPIMVGRSVRWFIADLIEWLRSKQRGNAQQSAPSVDKTVALKAASTGRQTKPEQPRSRLFLNPTREKMVPTVAELTAANRKVQAMKLQPGQKLLRHMIDTRDGARDWQYYVFPLVPGKGVAPVKVGLRKIIVPSGIPEAERLQLLARAAAMRAADASPPSSTVLATPKGGNRTAQKTEVSLTEMKAAYEVEGKSLDELCRRYRMSKGTLSRLLNEAGTKMRSPGRKTKPVKP